MVPSHSELNAMTGEGDQDGVRPGPIPHQGPKFLSNVGTGRHNPAVFRALHLRHKDDVFRSIAGVLKNGGQGDNVCLGVRQFAKLLLLVVTDPNEQRVILTGLSQTCPEQAKDEGQPNSISATLRHDVLLLQVGDTKREDSTVLPFTAYWDNVLSSLQAKVVFSHLPMATVCSVGISNVT